MSGPLASFFQVFFPFLNQPLAKSQAASWQKVLISPETFSFVVELSVELSVIVELTEAGLVVVGSVIIGAVNL